MTMILVKDQKDLAKLHKDPFVLQHSINENELFSLSRLVKLARFLPGDKIEYSSGKIKVDQAYGSTDVLEVSPEEVIASIEQNSAWMVLKRVESDPDYARLVHAFIHDLANMCEVDQNEFSDIQAFIFISSAHSITPFHVDPENNVLAHVKGEKIFHVFDNTDNILVSEEDLEISPSKHRNLSYKDSFEQRAKVYTLKPGDCVHVPYMTPHWVETGTDYCISIAITWKTSEVLRTNKIRLMNGTLRRFGFAQQPPGVSKAKDVVKVIVHDVFKGMIEPLRKSETIRRALRRVIYGRRANYYYDNNDKKV